MSHDENEEQNESEAVSESKDEEAPTLVLDQADVVESEEDASAASSDEADEDHVEEHGSADVLKTEGEQAGGEDHLNEPFALDEGDEPEEDKPEVKYGKGYVSRIKSLKEFFATEILYRYDILEYEDQELLRGKYKIEISPADGSDADVWAIDLSSGEVNVSQDEIEADSTISAYESDFMRIINGELNPQLAAVANKVRFTGDVRKGLLLQQVLSTIND